jgi:hypothetical protein
MLREAAAKILKRARVLALEPNAVAGLAQQLQHFGETTLSVELRTGLSVRLKAAALRGSPPLPMPIMVSDNAMRGYLKPKSNVVREPIEQPTMCALLILR